MLNLRLLKNILILFILVLLQVLIFSKINYKYIATPYIYILFILFYPIYRNRYIFLTLCFLLGWGIDIFENTGGIHAFACLTIGAISRSLVRLISGMKYFEVEEFRFTNFKIGQWIVYLSLMILIHHFLLYFFESFSLDNITEIMHRTLYSSIFTFIFVFFYLILFRKRIA